MGKKDRDRFISPETIKKIEKLEKSPQIQAQLQAVKNGMKEKVKAPFYIGCLGLIFIGIIALRLQAFPLILIYLAWRFGSKYLKKNKEDIVEAYVNHFLLPVLKEILPDTTVNYFERMDLEILRKLVYDSEAYYSNCHILFGDDDKTEFCNMESYHYTRDSDGHERPVKDFRGQVLLAQFPTQIKGHIRVVPLYKKNFLGHKSYGRYGKKRKDEEELETESMAFNEAYSIFSTDDFYTRLVLDPHILDILTHWKDQMRVCLYMNNKYISLAFESNEFLFSTPRTPKEIDDLSLAGEYEKIRGQLADFYRLIDRIGEKL